jgi:hypothetical protein
VYNNNYGYEQYPKQEKMMEHYHGSNKEITEIRHDGIFGGIFAAASSAAALSHGDILHRVESPRPLSDYALNYEIEGAYDVALEIAGSDERIADAIMNRECPALDDCLPEDSGEQGWEFQRLRGELARRLGFTSVEMTDEHGTTWLCLPGCTIAKDF